MKQEAFLLLESIRRFEELRARWYRLLLERQYKDAAEEFGSVHSAWEGVEGAWARLQLALAESEP